MSNSLKDRVAGIVIGPVMVFGGVVGLFQNETRFDYAEAAARSDVISDPSQAADDTVAYAGAFDTTLNFPGEYVQRFDGYFAIFRDAEIYAWEESRSDDSVTWSKEWQDRVESNSRNQGLRQTLYDGTFLPDSYQIGALTIPSANVHFADDSEIIPAPRLQLSREGSRRGLRVSGEYFYKGAINGVSQIGDERVLYEGLRPQSVMTYFGLMQRGRPVPYDDGVSTSGVVGMINAIIQNDGILYHVVAGDRDTAVATMAAHLSFTKWISRAVGTLMIVIGIYAFISVFTSLLYAIPLLGDLVETAVWLASIAIGLPIALSVMLIGFVLAHPLSVALPLALLIGAVVWFRTQKQSNAVNAGRVLEARLAAEGVSAPVAPTGAAEAASSLDPVTAGARLERLERTFANLSQMALAEGHFDKREKRFLIDWARKQGIPDDRIEVLFAEVKGGAEPAMPWKRSELELLVCMALADGVISNAEWKLLGRCAESVGVTMKEVKDMVADIQHGDLGPALELQS